MSNWPQRSVSASDQHWSCFFGANPEVLSERTVSDIIQPPIRDQKHDRLPQEASSHDGATFTSIKAIMGFEQHPS
jgi:hypothetical protein